MNNNVTGKLTNRRRYSLADGIDPAVLTSPEMLLTADKRSEKDKRESAQSEGVDDIDQSPPAPTHKSGDARCEVCGKPMVIVEAGQTTHPNCDPEENGQ